MVIFSLTVFEVRGLLCRALGSGVQVEDLRRMVRGENESWLNYLSGQTTEYYKVSPYSALVVKQNGLCFNPMRHS
ncbi:hypothetical protein RRG08_010410 [Elysia crispata]|uniref:Uncharacterized protein n=1 Tax=Elysia crispata TaxID=231223 RepID=A0AAE1BAU6_9GAST|nr:hypothetical protein RRG08_010410 [Elysia crispata]